MSEHGLARFIRLGAADADVRVARALAPRALAATDRYLWSSVVVQRFDRLTRCLREWWLASDAGGAVLAASEAWRREHWAQRYQAIAMVLILAASVHVSLTLFQGPRPGWFWLLLPALAVALAAILLVGSRAKRPTQ